jgi:predicted DNA-binding transcriptional regulator AlpA
MAAPDVTQERLKGMATLDGRRVRTRTELMDEHGLGRSTLEKWYRERAANGHPEPVGTVGSQLAWDAGEWDRWYAGHRARDVPSGLVTRDELAERHGISRHRLKQLWADRAHNGHPDAAHRAGKALYWDEAAWTAWYRTLRERPAEEGPDDLVTLAEAARILGLAQTSVTVYPKRPPAGWPEPAEVEPLGGGRVRRLYRRRDIVAYAARSRG